MPQRSRLFFDGYKAALTRTARRHTKHLIKKATSPRLEIEVWGRLRQDAYLLAGWHPDMESAIPDEDQTKMTMHLDILP